jgi:beta-1,4-mannosyl-glycoprotein beta-1,4-N-acetylglucosaminyltransferase
MAIRTPFIRRAPSSLKRTQRVDACIFCNELDLLILRLEELWEHVDYFVVVEADATFSGELKPLFFREYQAQFRRYKDKLIYRAITDLPPILCQSEEARFSREAAQRDAITQVVSGLPLSPHDVVIVSDVDEIPRANRLNDLEVMLTKYEYAIFLLTNHRGYVNNISDLALNGAAFAGPVACRVSTLLRDGAHRVRRGKQKSGEVMPKPQADCTYIDDGGWHFSSLGGPEAFWLKAANFSHIEDPHRVISLGDSVPVQRVFSAALDREQCRTLQQLYLAHSTAPLFSTLGFDTYEIPQSLPAFMCREKERFRGFFFFTDLV